MVKLLIGILGNSAAVYLAAYTVPGFAVRGGIKEFLFAGAVLGILNVTVKPLVKTVAFPVMILTLGLFSLVINAAMLWALTYIFSFVTIAGPIPLAWATIVVGAVNLVIFHKL